MRRANLHSAMHPIMTLVVGLMFFQGVNATAPQPLAPPLPARIGGTVSLNGTPLTQATSAGFAFRVTTTDNADFTDFSGRPAIDDDGLNTADWYVIDIPIYHATDQPAGALPGSAAILHVYHDGAELPVTMPAGGQIIVGESGSLTEIDLACNDCVEPSIPVPPASLTVCEGDPVTLSVLADGTLPLHYQWYQGDSGDSGTPVGDDQPTFSPSPPSASTRWWVRVTNACGFTDSPAALVTVHHPPVVAIQPESVQAAFGDTVTLQVTAESDNPMSYQWYRGASGDTTRPIPDSDSRRLDVPVLTDGESYWVRVTDSCGQADSSAGKVSAILPADCMFAAHLANTSDWRSWLLLANPGDEPASIWLILFLADGRHFDTVELPPLPPGGCCQVDADLFPELGDAWMAVRSDGTVQGVTVFGTRDGEALAAIPLEKEGTPRLLFPYVYQDGDWYTGLSLINTSPEASSVLLSGYSEAGAQVGSRTVVIPPRGKFVRLIQEIFAGENTASIRMVKADGDAPLIGFELFGTFVSPGVAALPAFPALDDESAGSAQACEPRRANPPPTADSLPLPPLHPMGWGLSDQSVYLVWTPPTDPTVVGYAVYRKTGLSTVQVGETDAASIQIQDLEPRTGYQFQVRSLDADGRKSPSTDSFAVCTLAPGEQDWPHRLFYDAIPDRSVFFTGATFVNPGPNPVDVYLDAMDGEGRCLARSIWTADPLAQVVRNADLFFPEGLPAGTIRLKSGSDTPLMGFELVYTENGPFQLDGLLAQPYGAKQWSFPLVRCTDGWNTWLRLCNVGGDGGMIQVSCLDDTGRSLAETSAALEMGGCWVLDMGEWLSGADPAGIAWVRVDATIELTASAEVRDGDQRRLAIYAGVSGE